AGPGGARGRGVGGGRGGGLGGWLRCGGRRCGLLGCRGRRRRFGGSTVIVVTAGAGHQGQSQQQRPEQLGG
ncbi:MAG: hypothetical protein F4Z70_13875, partial [Acidimicrobiia bacterium]|nr:hypothetical protein [Acidimicrobiia bacterium]